MAKKENAQASDDKKRFQEYNAQLPENYWTTFGSKPITNRAWQISEGAEFSEIYKITKTEVVERALNLAQNL